MLKCDGGDGGRGGNVYVRGNDQMWTLLHLKYKRHIKAGRGGCGSSNNSFGDDGEDKYIDVPLGTVVRDADNQEILFEVTEHGEEIIVRKGGLGGRGNSWFKNSVRQTPRYAQPGTEGEEGWVILELKVLADVGLVGFPNAGKSTLLSVISAAKPKIADYAFTTLVPNLGIVAYRENRSFVMADIPGIIKGASQGKGLGYRFLRHIERNSVLLYMIPADCDDIASEYDVLRNELEAYNPELSLRKDWESRPNESGLNYLVNEIDSTSVLTLDNISVNKIDVDHYPVEPAFGYEIKLDSSKVIYSGDTIYCKNLEQAALNADFLIHEVLVDLTLNETRMTEETVTNITDYHTSPKEVGILAENAKVKKLILNHFVPPVFNEEELYREVKEYFSGEVVVGKDLLEINL